MTLSPEARVSELVGNIYEAGLDARRWPELLKNLASSVGAPAASLWMHDFADGSASFDSGGGNVAAFVGYDEREMAEYAEHYSALNVWAAQTDRLPAGWVRTSSALFPDHLLRRTEFHAGFLAPKDLFHGLGCVIERQDSRAFTLGFIRSKRAGPFDAAEQALMHQLMPHLQTAALMHRKLHRLETLGAAAMAALDLLSVGVLLLTRSGTLLHANRAAQSAAAATGALQFGAGGSLRAATPHTQQRLQALIRSAVATGAGNGTSPGGAMRLPGPGGKALQVVVAPLPAAAQPFGHHVPAAVFCSDPDAGVAGLAAALQQLYAMSPAEAALTEALVNGHSVKDFAEQRRTSMNTVRSQLRSAAAKAGARRQADLVRMVLTGPAVWRQQR
jgi:DNA-binding CsgD family transcriptional regulator